MPYSVKKHPFDAPSGDVRGLVVAMLEVQGRSIRVGHATILVGKPPRLALKVPSGPLLTADVLDLSNCLREFAEAVELI